MSEITLERRLALANAQPIQEQSPVRLANGYTWTINAGVCNSCHASVTGDRFRGFVSKPFPNVAVLDAAAHCPSCGTVSFYFWRLHDDGRRTGPDPANSGRWITIPAQSRRATPGVRVLAFLVRALSALIRPKS